MLCAAGEGNTLRCPAIYETRRAFPWHYLESAIAAALIVAVSSLPVATVGAGSVGRGVTVWHAMGFLLDLASVGAGALATFAFALLFFVLLALGIASMADTAFCSVGCVRRGRVIASSWGMVVFGAGMMALCQAVGCQIAGHVFGLATLSVGPAVWVSIVGGLACGFVDLVRSRCA